MRVSVPFLDLQAVNRRFEEELREACARVLRSGWFLLAEETRAFENEFGQWTGAKHCICVANGLDALRLTLRAWISLGLLAAGDEVVVPANSYIASALAVTEAGLRIRFADIDPGTFNVSVETVTAALTPRTRVVMPVHLYGRLAEIEGIRTLCRSKGLLLLEDAAQAHGARAGSRSAGTFGDAAAFSFYPSKNLGALGDAGCVLTDDRLLAERVRALGNYGATAKNQHLYLGANSRIDEVQAAFLRIKLRRLEGDNERRRKIAEAMCKGLAHPMVIAPSPPPEPASHVWHLFVVRTTHRASLVDHLKTLGIETSIHYPCAIHRQPAYAEFSNVASAVPNTERLQHQVISLPISPVMSQDQVEHVISAVNRWRAPASPPE